MHPVAQITLSVLAFLVMVIKLIDSYVVSKSSNGHLSWGDAGRALLGDLKDIARQAVIHASEVTVANLKDSNKPGSWNDKAKEAVKAEVMAQTENMGSAIRARLKTLGYTDPQLDMFTSHSIEELVRETKTRGLSQTVLDMAEAAINKVVETSVTSVVASPAETKPS